jgi:hypothetical protein
MKKKNLFVYIDPGFLSDGGHYLKFADRLHSHSNSSNYDIHHYVGPKATNVHIQKLGLRKRFGNISYLSPFLSKKEIEKRLRDFSIELEGILSETKINRKKYSSITFFMYTSHPEYIKVFSKLIKKLHLKRWKFHLVFFYLNNSFIKNEKDEEYALLLNETNTLIEKQNNILLYMDSELSIQKYQKYFTNKIKLIGFPLFTDSYLKSLDGVNKKRESSLRIGFFGNLTEKHGFPTFYKLVKTFKDSDDYNFILKVNLKMHMEDELIANLREISKYSNVTVYDDYLDEMNQYLPIIKSCDAVVIPYSSEDYPVQTSGVFIDVITHKCNVIVSENTWMARKTKELDIGFTFDNITSLIEIVEGLRANLKSFDNKVEKFINEYTVNKFMKDFMEIEKRYTTSARKQLNLRLKKRAKQLRRQDKRDYSKVKFTTYPRINSKEKLADVINRLSFALALKDNIQISVYVDESLADITIEELKTPVGQSRYMKSLESFDFIIEDVVEKLSEGRILIHDSLALEEDLIYNQAHRVLIIDPEYFSTTESVVLRSIYDSTLDEKEKEDLQKRSRKRFLELIKKNKDKRNAYCFASGPSFDNYSDYEIDKTAFKIICNSIVKNTDFIEYIGGADLLVFADPVFHFGVSEYANQFRSDVEEYMKNTPSYIVVPEYTISLLEENHPTLKGWLIGMPHQNTENFNFPDKQDFFVKGTSNILTLFMLPIASAVSKNIIVFGADGRKSNETYFWKHSKSAQYANKMNDAFEVHPSFFRDRDYEDYYNLHCNRLELLLQTGEKDGIEYSSLSKSYIPSLKRRYINRSKFIKNLENRYLKIRHYIGNIKRFLLKVINQKNK